MENRLTSFELSKKLWDAGCNFTTSYIVIENSVIETPYITYSYDKFCNEYRQTKFGDFKFRQCYPAYDLLWDICVKYLDDFFPDSPQTQLTTERILNLLQNNKKNLAELCTWEHCLFNEKEK